MYNSVKYLWKPLQVDLINICSFPPLLSWLYLLSSQATSRYITFTSSYSHPSVITYTHSPCRHSL